MADSQHLDTSTTASAQKEKDTQVLTIIKEYRESGNVLFREGQFRKAMRKYHEANVHLMMFQGNPTVAMESQQQNRVMNLLELPVSTEKEEIQSLTISVTNNMAACALKLENWESVLRHSSKVLELEPDNQKANYRKGYAYLSLNNLDRAIEFLQRARYLDPKDSAVQKRLASAHQKMKEYQEKEKAIFKNIFDRE